MTMIRLHNDAWGFETNCFVCEPTNDDGLQITFFHDTDRDIVVAEFELSSAFSGAPTLVHGGITLAVLDEAMAWACIAVGGQWAVTAQTTTRFLRAVRVGSRYRVEARVLDHIEGLMQTSAEVLDTRDAVRAEAVADFTTLGEAQAIQVTGAEVTEANREFLARDHDSPRRHG
ncbi:MAG: PaaI family thioesterase [Ilumatobacteraceae bacterium]